MKLNLTTAWDQAVAMIAKNREVLIVLTGVFFFAPYLAFALFMPEAGFAPQPGAEGQMDMDDAYAALMAFYGEAWWAILLLALIQAAGTISVLTVLGDPRRPTVSDAISRGIAMIPSQFAAQFLTAFAIVTPFLVAAAIGAVAGAVAAGLLVILAIPIAIYILVKLSLSSPVIAIERTANPLAALARSWRITKGNSVRLFAFYLLLIVAFLVVSTIVTLVVGLVFAMFGESFALIGTAIVSSIINAVFAMFAYAVLASVHAQLTSTVTPAGVPRSGAD